MAATQPTSLLPLPTKAIHKTKMPYRFKKREAVADGIRRIAAEEIDDAIGQLAGGENREEAVHEARKSVKKVRALLRLAPGGGAEDKRFRDIGRSLSDARDAAVMLETLDGLAAKHQATLNRIRVVLERNKQSVDTEAGVQPALYGLRSARDRIKDWSIPEELTDSLRASYRRGRKALREVEKNATEESYHDFRKCAKEHGYHLRLFESTWTEQIETRAGKIKDLETWLGDHHNLAVLRAKIENHPEQFADAEEIQLFLALVLQEQKELERNSMPVGRDLYEQKPKHFMRDMAKLWEAPAPKKQPAKVLMRKAKTA